MRKLIFISIITALAAIQTGYSQQASYMSIQYAVGIGLGDLGDYISAPSFRGANIEYRNAVTNNLMVGAEIGWNVFYERMDYNTYTVGTESLTGVQYRTQNELPILLSADYILTPDNPFRPYVGLGIGTLYSERSTDMGMWRRMENPWHFAIKPEVGFLYELSYSTSFKFAAKYYSGFASSPLETQSYLSLSVGLAFTL